MTSVKSGSTGSVLVSRELEEKRWRKMTKNISVLSVQVGSPTEKQVGR